MAKAKAFRLFIFLYFLSFSIAIYGQPTFKEKVGDDLWLESNISVYFNGHSRLILGGNAQRNTFSGDRLGNSPFDETNLFLGYEHFFKEKWQAQVSQSRNRSVLGHRSISSGALQHNGRIESLIFTKSFQTQWVRFNESVGRSNNWNSSFGVYLGKRITLNKLQLQTGLRYEIVRNWEAVGDPRRISKTRLWFENQLFVTRNAQLSLFAMRETDYFFAEEVYGLDADDNLVLLKPYRKLNLYTPTYGIRLRITIHPEKAHQSMPFLLQKMDQS